MTAPPSPAVGSPETPPSVLMLPAEVESMIFARLSASELAACMATCRAWRQAASSPPLWNALIATRWRHDMIITVPEVAHAAVLTYVARRQMDAVVIAVIKTLQWPDRRRFALCQLPRLPYAGVRDALEQLSDDQPGPEWPDVAAVVAASPCGVPYWAHWAHSELQVQHCAQHLRSQAALVKAATDLLAERAAAAPAAAALGAGAAGPGDTAAASELARVQPPPAASSAPGPPGSSLAAAAAAAAASPAEQQQQQGSASEPAGPSSSAAAVDLRLQSDDQLRRLVALSYEEGSLALAQVHCPWLSELLWVRQALDALGAELQRRMAAAGVRGGLPALQLLNQLLFGAGPPPRHPRFASIPPPDGFGLEITGNRERYYEPCNSLLDSVLTNQEGIPISLAVLHTAVAVRAGLSVTPLDLPLHVVCGLAADGEGEDEGEAEGLHWFIDVFEGGRVMDSTQFHVFVQGLGLPAERFNPPQVMTPQQCWKRQCRNLLHLYREQGEWQRLKAVALLMAAASEEDSAEGMRAAVEASNACMELRQYDEAAELLQAVADGPYQGQGAPAAGPHPSGLQAMRDTVLSAGEHYAQRLMRVHRRQGQRGLKYKVGDVLRHKRYQYRGVIVGWDPECQAGEEWIEQMRVDRLPGGRHQPFYHVLPDPEDRPGQDLTYVAQENIELEALSALHSHSPGFALHPDVGRYFTRLARGGARYYKNEWMWRCYPDDWRDECEREELGGAR
ncbi:hypothetical protein D9Q98_007088 [Chlorella vulgaris]|uniref:F-box domain-containing protein n=1 Tax=Chlorella vulgaris TaxID=3077 RepID=A0A9D4TJH3_CHLVU|nr:hypothetical protein D9Q98_007088 [Chlorella vulgaris]